MEEHHKMIYVGYTLKLLSGYAMNNKEIKKIHKWIL